MIRARKTSRTEMFLSLCRTLATAFLLVTVSHCIYGRAAGRRAERGIGQAQDRNDVVHVVESSATDATLHIGNATNSLTSTGATQPVLCDTRPTRASVAGQEKASSLTILFILLVVALCILVTHVLVVTRFRYLPESVAVVLIGLILGLVMRFLYMHNLGNWQVEETFPPTVFFLVLLPPIIFESGYNLHKGNFFANLGTILLFAIFGTVLSAAVVGGGIYLLGLADVVFKLDLVQSFAFGSLISAVDPVATLAIFHALNVEPVLHMLVFGESVLNDAVAIVLTTTVMELNESSSSQLDGGTIVLHAIGRFCVVFFASAAIGVAFALASAILLKIVDLRHTPSLEIGLMLVFSYLPYGLAEGLGLSGIMAILFAGIVMSHYTHLNLSPVAQITVQQTFRTVSFMAETCVFAYLGLALSSFHHVIEVSLILWSLALCLIGRAINIFPLALLANAFRQHKISRKTQFVMWFSGLRGAIAFALCLNLEFEPAVRHVLVTTTLVIVLSTVLVLGGLTLPLLKVLKAQQLQPNGTQAQKEVFWSKTKEMGETIDTEVLPPERIESKGSDSGGSGRCACAAVPLRACNFSLLDAKYFMPLLTRRLTQDELDEGRRQISSLASSWYRALSSSDTSQQTANEGDDNCLVDNDDNDNQLPAGGREQAT